MRRGAVVVAVLGLVAACSGDDDGEPTPIGGDTPATQEDADAGGPEPDEVEDAPSDDEGPDAEIGVDTIPDDPAAIDEGYVQAVLDEVDQRLAEGFGALRAYIDGELEAEQTLERLGVVYEGPLAAERLAFFGDGNGADAVEPAPSSPQSQLTDIQTVEADCVSVVVERDVSGMLTPPGDPRAWSLTLVPAADPDGLAWRLRHDFSGDEQGIDFDGCIEEVPS